jgi:ribosome-binding protein aMBF1 (putative translation factor)
MGEPDSDDLTAYLAEQLKDGRFSAAYHAAGDRARIIRTLVAARVKAGLTADQVAKRMQVKPKDVRAYERGATDPALSFHQRYAHAVGLRVRVEIEQGDADG